MIRVAIAPIAEGINSRNATAVSYTHLESTITPLLFMLGLLFPIAYNFGTNMNSSGVMVLPSERNSTRRLAPTAIRM